MTSRLIESDLDLCRQPCDVGIGYDAQHPNRDRPPGSEPTCLDLVDSLAVFLVSHLTGPFSSAAPGKPVQRLRLRPRLPQYALP